MEGDGERLGQRRRAEVEARGHGDESVGRHLHVAGEGTVGTTGTGVVPAGAERRAPGGAGGAVPAGRTGPTHHGVAHRPPGHRVAEVDDPPGVLVAADGARPAPAVEDEVQVAPAHPAVADLDEHVPGTGAGHGPVLDLEATGTPVDRGGHGRRKHRHGRERI